jgi:hypothetical protein
MDERDESGDIATADFGEHLRTWRLFVIRIRWVLAATALALVLLLVFRTHG